MRHVAYCILEIYDSRDYLYLTNILIILLFFFFFSSRRRHTRYWRDWSSDVCSSDLIADALSVLDPGTWTSYEDIASLARTDEIGRASCRERVSISVVAVSLKKKKIRKLGWKRRILSVEMVENIIVSR